MKIYISGKITGLDIEKAKNNFEKAEIYIEKELNSIAVNPFKVKREKECIEWKDYMISDIKALLECNAIYMLKDWKNSKGARLERHIASELNLIIINEN